MALVTSLSQTLGLHEIYTYEGLDPGKQRLYKRIAWYSFIRDQQIALALTRPPTMKSTQHTIPMLTLDDFDFEPIREHYFGSEIQRILGGSFPRQRKLAILCIETAKLCVCVSHILETQHTVKRFSNSHAVLIGGIYKHAILQARDDNIAAEGRQRCDAELQSWFSECTQGTNYTESLICHLLEDDESTMVHRAMLHCLYYTAVCALHQASFDNASSQTAAEKELSFQKTQQAAREISNIVQEIQHLGLVALVPSYGSTPVMYAIMAHLRGMKSQYKTKRREAWDAFNTCTHMIRLLAETYHGAEAIFELLTATSQRTKLIPKTIEELESTAQYDAQGSRSSGGLLPRATAQVNCNISGLSPGIGALDMVTLGHNAMDLHFSQQPTGCASSKS